jgi:hypothetical protein
MVVPQLSTSGREETTPQRLYDNNFAQRATTILDWTLVTTRDLAAYCTATFKETHPKAFVWCNNTNISGQDLSVWTQKK